MKQTLIELRREIIKSTIIVEDFNSPLLIIDRKTGRKIRKDVEELKNTIIQQYLFDSYKTHDPIAAECAFFSSVYIIFPKVDHILGYKTNLNKFKIIENSQNVFCDHNGIKAKIKIQHIKICETQLQQWLEGNL